jgi:hypothetical protein
MEVVAEAFRTGGVWMYLILTIAVFGWPLSLLAPLTLLTKKAKLAIAAGIISGLVGLAAIGVGAAGYAVGMAEVEEALTKASPEYRERLRVRGEEYASYSLYFGLGAGSVPLLFGLLALGGGIAMREPE